MKIDLEKRQNKYHEATVKNVMHANDFTKASQNWSLILGLAEMSFLATLIVQVDANHIFYLKCFLSALLISFVLFILGSIKQYKHALASSRYYHCLANKVTKHIRSMGPQIDETEVPQEINEEKHNNQIATDKIANILILSSIGLILLVTLGLIPIIVTL